MARKEEWQGGVGKAWAREWQRTDRSFGVLTEHLMAHAREIAPARMLDLGCGAGQLAITYAQENAHAHIIGLDISADLIAAATSRSSAPNVEFVLGDGASWSREDFAPDLILSRHGVMFFVEPIAAFTHLRSLCAKNGKLVFSCFQAVARNAWAQAMMQLISNAPADDPRAPGPFAFADPDYVTEILTGAGWANVSASPLDFTYTLGAGDDPIADAIAFLHSIGPAARALRELEGDAKAQYLTQLDGVLRANLHGDRVEMPGAAWIITADAA